jgi:DNA polymerase elongation subunit (family B)
MEQSFRIFDFNVYNEKDTSNNGSESEEDQEQVIYKDTTIFLIQIFGINETGKTFSVIVEGFKPFFYVMVNDTWNISIKDQFLENIKMKMGKFYENTINECIIIKRKKLYGFDGGKEHKFIKLEFNSFAAFNKAKNLWYSDYSKDGRKLLENGYYFNNTETRLYEANIPPLLRFFHIKDLSPSGWISISNKKITEKKILELKGAAKTTTCNHEFIIEDYKDITPLNHIEKLVPYKICSFDIEASSSHGDFPIPVKSYKKLATNITDYFEALVMEVTPSLCKNILKRIMNTAFGFEKMDQIDIVYPKTPIDKMELETIIEKWFSEKCKSQNKNSLNINTIEKLFHKSHWLSEFVKPKMHILIS